MELIIIQDLVVLSLKKRLKNSLEISLETTLAVLMVVLPMVVTLMATLLVAIDKVAVIKEQVLIQVIEVDTIVFWESKMEQVKKKLKRLIVKLAKEHHPDKFVNASDSEKKFHENKMKEINEAYENLKI